MRDVNRFLLTQKPKLMFLLSMRLTIARRDTFLYEYVWPFLNWVIAMPRSGDTATRAEQDDVRNGTMNIDNRWNECVYVTQLDSQALHLAVSYYLISKPS